MNTKLTLNYILFLALSFLIIFGYSYYFGKSQKEEKTNTPATTENVTENTQTTQSPTTSQAPIRSVSSIEENVDHYDELLEDGNGRIITIDTPLYTGKINTNGGRVTEWRLKDYKATTAKNSPPVNIINGEKRLITNVSVNNANVPFLIPFNYSGPGNVELTDTNKGVTLNYTNASGFTLTKTIEFELDNYLLNESMTINNQSGNSLEYGLGFEAFGKIEQKGRGDSSDELIVLVNNEIEKVTSIPKVPEQFNGQINWFGLNDKYFLIAVIPEIGGNSTISYSALNSKQLLNAKYSYPREIIKAGNTSTIKWKTYLGPKEPKNLDLVGYGLSEAINWGWLGILAEIALKFLKILNSVFHNYGISIIAITVILRVLFLPLTLKSMRSMKLMQAKMQDIKPKVDALKEKYKDDKTKQNAELMKLYTSHGVNPLSSLGGCFPLLLQLPVFIALYDVLLYSIDLRQSSFLWINDLAEPEHLFNIPLIGEYELPFRILPLLMGVSWYISQKMTPVTAPGSESMELQMKMMQFMPIIFTVMFWSLPSGLILYWTVSNILSIFQQIYINRTVHAVKGGT
jgi:YidC/Oxa1 family membrane protein insertase